MKFQNVRGMRDFLPEKARKKQFIEDLCRAIFEKYGFGPLETPAVEEFGLLSKKGSGGEAIKDEIYYFKDKGNRELGLRFDLTVPLARVVANNPQLAKPFKRYQIAPVWRYDRPQAQRYREFTQADFDIVGTGSLLAEFECIAVIVEVMQKLGLDFYIKLNDKRLLEAIAIKASVEKSKVKECLRSLDKLEKIGEKEVEKELKGKGINTQILGQLKRPFREFTGEESAAPLTELMKMLKENGLDKYVKVDLSLARGLVYYTGIVFEVCIEKGPSVGGGGRYDELIALYGGSKTSAVGFSFGIDRLLDVMDEKLETLVKTKIFVAPINEKFNLDALKLVQKIRALGINASMDLMSRGISRNLEYANKQLIPFVIVLGENELKAKEIKLKDMKTGKEKKIKFSELEKLKELVK